MVFQTVQNKADNIVQASFLVSEKIAKHSKPYSDGEFVKEYLSALDESIDNMDTVQLAIFICGVDVNLHCIFIKIYMWHNSL